jgi:hypothetical protein
MSWGALCGRMPAVHHAVTASPMHNLQLTAHWHTSTHACMPMYCIRTYQFHACTPALKSDHSTLCWVRSSICRGSAPTCIGTCGSRLRILACIRNVQRAEGQPRRHHLGPAGTSLEVLCTHGTYPNTAPLYGSRLQILACMHAHQAFACMQTAGGQPAHACMHI